jgi:hypothetical protein
MFALALAACALLSAVLALALVREVRLRRALEAVLRRLLAAWRGFRGERETDAQRRAGECDHPDDRL